MQKPTRAEAAKSWDAFYELLKVALARPGRNRRPLTLTQLGDAIGGFDKSAMSRKIASRRFSDQERKDALHHIYEKWGGMTDDWREAIEDIPHYLYFALLQFFGTDEPHREKTSQLTEGTYELWRFSVDNEDEFVHGKLVFSIDEKNGGALCVDMAQRKTSREGLRASVEEFTGYLVPIGTLYVMVLHDEPNNDPRVTIFYKCRAEPISRSGKTSIYPPGTPHVVSMDGFAIGRDGGIMFVSPVYLTLVDSKEQIAALDQNLDTTTADKIPTAIVKRLRKFRLQVSG